MANHPDGRPATKGPSDWWLLVGIIIFMSILLALDNGGTDIEDDVGVCNLPSAQLAC